MIISADAAVRAERIAALAEAAVVGPLAQLDTHSRPTALPVAGGQVVLLGPGMYVNRGMALGLGMETTTVDLEALEAASRRSGVPAELEVTPLAEPSLLRRADAAGYRPGRLPQHARPGPPRGAGADRGRHDRGGRQPGGAGAVAGHRGRGVRLYQRR